MKKIIIALTLLLLVSGCSKEDSIQEEKETYSSWVFEGEGKYTTNLSEKLIVTNKEESHLVSPGFSLQEGVEYYISFNAYSDDDTEILLEVYDDNNLYINDTISLTKEDNIYNYSFTAYGYTDNAKVKFSFVGNDKNKININDFSIESNILFKFAKINQVGYLSNLNKKVVFFANQGDYFSIYDENDEIVYKGMINDPHGNQSSKETLQTGYFKEFCSSGTYYIKSELGAYSREFVIGDEVFDELKNDSLRFIYTQRCGQDISYEISDEVYHNACHTQDTKLYTTLSDTYFDTVGGWHDASDYGRYVQTTDKTIADLLFAYLYSNNKDEALLDEARYGLDWLLKLQKEDGSVYNKITTELFADYVLPENDRNTMYALRPWTLTTASFAGVMGLGYKTFKDIDQEFAESCLNAHRNAIDYLSYNKEPIQELNPDSFSTGEYQDGDENDERLFAYSVAYDISKNKEDLDLLKEIIDLGLDSQSKNMNCRIYGIITILESLEKRDKLYKKAYESLINECNGYTNFINTESYSYPYDSYNWGSNSHLCDVCSKLLFAYKYSEDERYLDAAASSIDYVMGLNTLDMCFVYGYGYRYPSTIHHRVANVRGTLIKGALAGGVDQFMTEGVISKYLDEETPNAKRFVDRSDSYTNVEPAIYYNSSLVLALNLLDSENKLIKK